MSRDCNPGLEFSIPVFGIVEFPISGSLDPVGIGVKTTKTTVKTTKIATWVTVFGPFHHTWFLYSQLLSSYT